MCNPVSLDHVTVTGEVVEWQIANAIGILHFLCYEQLIMSIYKQYHWQLPFYVT